MAGGDDDDKATDAVEGLPSPTLADGFAVPPTTSDDEDDEADTTDAFEAAVAVGAAAVEAEAEAEAEAARIDAIRAQVPAMPADADENHTVPEIRAMGATLVGRAVLGALAFTFTGYPKGAATQVRSGPSVLRAWAPWFQVGLVLAAAGGVTAAATDDETLQPAGLALAVIGVGIALVAWIVAAAVEHSVPPGKRPMPASPDDPFRPVGARTALLPWGDGVWIAQRPLTFFGLSVGARMTLLDTGDGWILVSPIDADPVLVDQVETLGEVRWIVAPNPIHHLWVKDWAAVFPDAELWAPEALQDRRADLPWTGTLDDHTAPWDTDVVDVAIVPGHALLTEAVLCHRPSATLVVSDIVQNHGQDGVPMPSWAELLAFPQRPGPPVDYKLTIADPAATAAGIARVLTWDFDRIVLAHGALISDDGHEILSDAFAFVRG